MAIFSDRYDVLKNAKVKADADFYNATGIDPSWIGRIDAANRVVASIAGVKLSTTKVNSSSENIPKSANSNEKLPVVGKTTGYGNTDFIYRYDDNFSINVNSKGRMKAYIDNEGNLVPPNIYGKGSIQSQVRGSNPEKSPYISFTDPKYSVTPKNYGKEKISIDINRLEKDVSNNKLLNVEILRHDKVISELNNKLNIAKQRYVDNPSIKKIKKD